MAGVFVYVRCLMSAPDSLLCRGALPPGGEQTGAGSQRTHYKTLLTIVKKNNADNSHTIEINPAGSKVIMSSCAGINGNLYQIKDIFM